MYQEFFQMKAEAFSNQPLPGLFFTSKSHQSVWACLVSEINRSEPFLLVTGEYGMGKTTLCLKLVRALKKHGRLPFLHIATPNYDYTAILQRIAGRLGLAVEGLGLAQLQDRIFQYFEQEQPPKGIILIFDDVQDMGMATLANLRLLVNFSHDGYFPFRLILFGHPSFIQRLHSQVLRALNQRIRRRLSLEPLSPPETREYVYFRLYRAGGTGSPIFTDEALRLLYDYSRGIPRLINNVCDICLFLAASEGVDRIDQDMVANAVRYLQAEPPGLPEQPQDASSPPPVRPIVEGQRVRVIAGESGPATSERQPAAPAFPAETAAGVVSAPERSAEARDSGWPAVIGTFEPSSDLPAEGQRERSNFVWLVVILVAFLVGLLLVILVDVKSVFKGFQ